MSGARRRARREAKYAVKQLMKQGLPASAIGAIASTDKLKFTLMKIVNKLDRKLDTGEGDISIREGLAAIGEIRKLEQAQGKMIEQAAEHEAASPLYEEATPRTPAQQPSLKEAGITEVSAAATPLKAAG